MEFFNISLSNYVEQEFTSEDEANKIMMERIFWTHHKKMKGTSKFSKQ